MKVFVAGGTGAIGRHAVGALVRTGHQVTALARSPEKAAVLRSQGAVPTTVSIFDRAELRKAFNGHEAIVNLASAIVDAAIAAGVTRVVQESVSMLYRDRGDAWIDEDWPTDDYPMARANHAAEASAGTYNVVDDEPLTKRAYADALAAAIGKRAWLRAPGRLALLLGDRSTSLTRSVRVSNRRFRRASGWLPAYPSAREGLKAMARVLAERRT